MTDILFLLIGTILVNIFVLAHCPAAYLYKGPAGKLHTNIALAAATSLVLVVSSICDGIIHHFLLLPFDAAFLQTLTYLLTMATMVNMGAFLIRKLWPDGPGLPGMFLQLITTNAAVLGLALVIDNKTGSIAGSAFYGCGMAAGFSLLLILFSLLHEQLKFADVPKPLQGAGITLITAGLVSLGFAGLAGLV